MYIYICMYAELDSDSLDGFRKLLEARIVGGFEVPRFGAWRKKGLNPQLRGLLNPSRAESA